MALICLIGMAILIHSCYAEASFRLLVYYFFVVLFLLFCLDTKKKQKKSSLDFAFAKMLHYRRA